MIYTTLNKIREQNPCADGWQKLLASLNKTAADDEPLALVAILESNGLDDALWALRAADCDREARLFAVACGRRVQHLMPDPRSIAALDIAELYATGLATAEELGAAGPAAWDAWAAARAAARAARAARDAAWAARAAAWAAWAARAAAWAARDARDAWDAAWAARAAAWAAWAARDARDARDAWAAAEAAWAAQSEIFKSIFGEVEK